MYTSSAAANNENADPSSASSRLNASEAKPAPSAKAVTCTTRKNSVGRSLIQLPQGMCSLLVRCRRIGVAAGWRPYVAADAGARPGGSRGLLRAELVRADVRRTAAAPSGHVVARGMAAARPVDQEPRPRGRTALPVDVRT